MKILTVDDSKTIRMIVAKAFKPYDCEIVEASNGVEGLEAAAAHKPDLIILDITMPVMDGVEALGKLKADPALKAIPVMMLTAESGRENVLKIAKIGIRDYLIKPFKENQLIEKVSRIVQLQPAKGGGAGKTMDDPLSILVVDDKPAIIQQLVEGLTATSWKIQGKSTTKEALDEVGRNLPDAILLNLLLAGDSGFEFFQQLRANPLARQVPVFGMCIKTDQATQDRAEKAGFDGVITKPIDIETVKAKLTRAMHLDTSTQYFSMHGDILVLEVPAKITTLVAKELERYLVQKVQEMVDSGMNKFILDLRKVVEIDIPVVKTIILTVQNCEQLSLRLRIVANATMTAELKTFQETSSLVVDRAMEDAKAVLQSPMT